MSSLVRSNAIARSTAIRTGGLVSAILHRLIKHENLRPLEQCSGNGKGLPFSRVRALPGFESQGTGRFMEGGETMRWRKCLLDQLGIEGNAIEIAEAAKQPQPFLILQVSPSRL